MPRRSTSQRLSEDEKERLRKATVSVILALRGLYLANGGNALKHWTQIEDRIRVAVRVCETPQEWVSKLKSDLQIPQTSSSLSSETVMLCEEVDVLNAATQWLSMVELELGYVMALARLEAEDRAEQREARINAEETVA